MVPPLHSNDVVLIYSQWQPHVSSRLVVFNIWLESRAKCGKEIHLSVGKHWDIHCLNSEVCSYVYYEIMRGLVFARARVAYVRVCRYGSGMVSNTGIFFELGSG